jgi:hypothetical protein
MMDPVQSSPVQSSIGSGRRALLAGVALLGTLSAGPLHAAAEEEPSAASPQREQLTISPEELMKPWNGDLDGMVERGFIRVLTTYSKTFYFVDKGVQRGRSPTYSGSSRRI